MELRHEAKEYATEMCGYATEDTRHKEIEEAYSSGFMYGHSTAECNIRRHNLQLKISNDQLKKKYKEIQQGKNVCSQDDMDKVIIINQELQQQLKKMQCCGNCRYYQLQKNGFVCTHKCNYHCITFMGDIGSDLLNYWEFGGNAFIRK